MAPVTVTPDSELREIDRLALRVDGMEQQLASKGEELQFVSDMIAEREAQCRQLKEQHEQKIRQLTQQARKQRSRTSNNNRNKPEMMASSAAALVASASAPDMEEEEGEVKPPGARPAVLLDLTTIDKAIGQSERRRVVGESPSAAGMDADSLQSLCAALAAQRDLVRAMSERVEMHVQRLEKGEDAGDERSALEEEVSYLLDNVI
eukprot:TRINITY_DN10868_c0_g1_i1.p1 TRINITY_DN10868_c0_g1~~TRINITY_DN10868_c0_g1_i1.p1  ORF type:complete len:233 (-),score=43.94 TRINITY_DN10868_c0_g1_i1:130-747(-)